MNMNIEFSLSCFFYEKNAVDSGSKVIIKSKGFDSIRSSVTTLERMNSKYKDVLEQGLDYLVIIKRNKNKTYIFKYSMPDVDKARGEYDLLSIIIPSTNFSINSNDPFSPFLFSTSYENEKSFYKDKKKTLIVSSSHLKNYKVHDGKNSEINNYTVMSNGKDDVKSMLSYFVKTYSIINTESILYITCNKNNDLDSVITKELFIEILLTKIIESYSFNESEQLNSDISNNHNFIDINFYDSEIKTLINEISELEKKSKKIKKDMKSEVNIFKKEISKKYSFLKRVKYLVFNQDSFLVIIIFAVVLAVIITKLF